MPRNPSNPQSTDELENPPMRTQPHGGSLRTGGTNVGGPGATPSTLRMAHRRKLMATLETTHKAMLAAAEILEGKTTSRSMKLRAAEVIFKGHDAIGKYSGTASVTLTDSDGNAVDLPKMVIGVQAPTTSTE